MWPGQLGRWHPGATHLQECAFLCNLYHIMAPTTPSLWGMAALLQYAVTTRLKPAVSYRSW
jgi:hypothetical protein